MFTVLHISNGDASYGSGLCLKELVLAELKVGIKPIVLTLLFAKTTGFLNGYKK